MEKIIHIEVTEVLHRRFKAKAAQSGLTLKQALIEAIIMYLEKEIK